MNRKSAVRPIEWVAFAVILVMLGLCMADAARASDRDRDPDIEIDVDADGGEGGDADANSDADANAEANGEQNVTFEGSRSVGRGYIGGGSSTATDQKVRAISGGWLTGMASLRWDATDKELRTLRRADLFRERGLIASADRMECSTKVIYKAIGGDPDACYTELAGSHVVESEKRTRRDVEQDAMILALQEQLASIYERELPQAQDTHEVQQVELAQVQATVEETSKATAELEALAAEYRADRAAEQERAEKGRMAAQESLDLLQQAYPIEEPPDDEL